ncbi:MAG: tripartite tricarboxylate transporter substrate-binding protein, partial [Hyphomicrobiaceae bacterium]
MVVSRALALSVNLTMVGIAAFAATSVGAQDAWPGQRIQMVVPASAGSGTDIMARKMSDALGAALKTTIVVENRPGASGVLGTNAVVKAPPDGNTLLYTNASFAVMAPVLL